MALDFKEVFTRHWRAYSSHFGGRIPDAHRRAAWAIMDCRTEALGGSVHRCDDCGTHHYAYHSCNHRNCPQCGYQDAMDWAQRQKEKLLPVDYAMATLTIPEELRRVFRSNQRLCFDAMFRCSAQALQEMAAIKRHLGGQLGILSVLHTWTRQLEYHPHIHCIVPMGGLADDGTWQRPKNPKYFLPVEALSVKMRILMEQAIKAEDPELFATIPKHLWRKKWVTHIKTVGRGDKALEYIARYVSQSALSKNRILSDDAEGVSISYVDSDTGEKKILPLSGREFIRRYLQHVLPKGLKRIRYYGFLSPAAHKKLERIRGLLKWKPTPPEAQEDRAPCCPTCEKTLTALKTWRRSRAPPLEYYSATNLYEDS